MDLKRKHFEAIQSGQLAVVRAFVKAHPERLNQVRSGIKWGRKGRKRRREEEEEKERNSP